jgi:hypothetical protein
MRFDFSSQPVAGWIAAPIEVQQEIQEAFAAAPGASHMRICAIVESAHSAMNRWVHAHQAEHGYGPDHEGYHFRYSGPPEVEEEMAQIFSDCNAASWERQQPA